MISRSVVVGAVAIDGMAFSAMIIGGMFCRVGTMGHSGLGAVSGRRTMINLFAMMAAGHDGRLATEHLAHSDVEQEDGGLEQRQADQAFHQVSGRDHHIQARHHQDDDRDVVEALEQHFHHDHQSSSLMSGTRPAKA